MTKTTSRSPGGTAKDLLVLAVVHFVVSILSAKLFYAGSSATGVWLANAITVAMILRGGYRSLLLPSIAIGIAALAANVALSHSMFSVLIYASTNLIAITLGAWLVSHFYDDWRQMAATPQSYAKTLLLCGGVAPALAGLAFAATQFDGNATSFMLTWWYWWSGDALGHVIILPLCLLASAQAFADLRAPETLVRLAVAMVGVVAVAAAATMLTTFPFVLLLVPHMLAAAFLAPLPLAIVSTAGVMTVVGTVALGLSPIVGPRSYPFQIPLAITVLLPLLGALLVEQIRRDRKRTAESEQRFRRAMKDSPIGVAIISLDGRVIETNAAFAEMLGYSSDELQTKTFMDLTHDDDRDIGDEALRRVRAGETESYRFEKRYVRKDGTRIWTQLAGSVINDDVTGAPLYLVSQIENIDARKTSQLALAEAESRWNFALSAAGQGVWDLDCNAGRATYSATWKEMLGYDADDLDGDPDHWLMLIHPEDRERVEKIDRDHMAGLTAMFEAEFRMRHKQGHYLWILDRGQVIQRNPDGSVARAIGTLTDITMRRESEERIVSYAAMLAEEKERLRVTLSSIGDAVICTDAQNRVTFMNPTAVVLTAIAEAAALGRPLSEAYRAIDEETGQPLGENSAEGEIHASHNNRAVLVRRDGSRCSIREVRSRIVTERGEFGGSVIVFQDFTDARTLQRELAYAASHDALTGLANRSSFVRTVQGVIDGDTPDAGQILFIDLDRFKLVNDTSGHAAGDALLKRVADMIAGLVRPGDVVARLGGDEFAALLKSCRPREAEALANRIVGAIGAMDFQWNGHRHSVGASIGIAAVTDELATVDDVIALADEACYSAKASGRNCVVTVEPRPMANRKLAAVQ